MAGLRCVIMLLFVNQNTRNILALCYVAVYLAYLCDRKAVYPNVHMRECTSVCSANVRDYASVRSNVLACKWTEKCVITVIDPALPSA